MYERNISQIEEIVQKQNQWRGSTLNLIASENVLSDRARQVMGSDFAHRYAEGHPGERYYQGTELIDEIESRLKKRGQRRCVQPLHSSRRCGNGQFHTGGRAYQSSSGRLGG